MENESNLINQTENSRPWLYKKGQSGNLKGRPKGSLTLKGYLSQRFAKMSDEEREEFFEGMDKSIMWKMAEGNPKQDTDVTSGGKPLPKPLLLAIEKELGSEEN